MATRHIKNEVGCIVCGSSPTDVDHIKTIGSGGKDVDANKWNLCRDHHIEKHSLGLSRFVKRYPDMLLHHLEQKGWEYDDYLGRWTRDLDLPSQRRENSDQQEG